MTLRKIVESLVLVAAAFALGVAGGMTSAPVAAQADCDDDTVVHPDDCDVRSQCPDATCDWTTGCLTVPTLSCDTSPDPTYEVTVTVETCTDDVYEVVAALYDDRNCGASGEGYLTGGSLTQLLTPANTWEATFCVSTKPDNLTIDWAGLPGNNYWTYGIKDVEVEWCCAECEP
jgi:hypothetical protein